jgi:hypothetical protein
VNGFQPGPFQFLQDLRLAVFPHDLCRINFLENPKRSVFIFQDAAPPDALGAAGDEKVGTGPP